MSGQRDHLDFFDDEKNYLAQYVGERTWFLEDSPTEITLGEQLRSISPH